MQPVQIQSLQHFCTSTVAVYHYYVDQFNIVCKFYDYHKIDAQLEDNIGDMSNR